MSCRTYNKDILVRQQNIKGAFFKKMLQMIKNDARICFLTADALMENSILRNAMQEYPDRIIDVGIAEQNLVGMASGFALSGMIPFVSAMAPFLPLRALEQIHTDIAYNDVPVKLISVSSGTVSGGGPTHNLNCDFAVLNAIPNITILSPSDMNQFITMLEMVVDYQKPVYIRMPQADWKSLYTNNDTFEIGKAVIRKEGRDGTVIATGRCVSEAIIASEVLQKDGIQLGVIDMHTIKPIDCKAVMKAAMTGNIIVAEDHNTQGGLGSMVESVIAKERYDCNIYKLGIPDEFSVLGKGKEIASHYHFDSDGIIRIMNSFHGSVKHE